jgi:hypothetical protein
MKKITLFLAVICMLGAATSASAQGDDKKLRKEWATRLKNMDPMEFKKMIEEHEEITADNNKLRDVVADLQKDVDTKTVESEKLKAEIKQLRSNMDSATKPEKNTVDATRAGIQRAGEPQGLIFKVQIGAFKNKNLAKYLDNSPNFSGDIDQDGTKKYTLGYFSDYWEANRFKKYLREMGVKDAWIVSYKDGQRVEIKDALEGAI